MGMGVGKFGRCVRVCVLVGTATGNIVVTRFNHVAQHSETINTRAPSVLDFETHVDRDVRGQRCETNLAKQAKCNWMLGSFRIFLIGCFVSTYCKIKCNGIYIYSFVDGKYLTTIE